MLQMHEAFKHMYL